MALTATPTASAEESPRAGDATSLAPVEPLLESPRHGRTAIRRLGDQLAVAAARNDLRPAELRTLLRADESAWIDPRGTLYYVDPVPERTSGAGEASAAVAPLAETFELHSNPGASLTILLDVDGAEVSGTSWNSQQNVTPGDHPAWDPAGDGPSFSDGERAMVQQVWATVAEDYAPFDVDVTTEDPGDAGLVRSSSSDSVYGTRVLVTPSDDPFAKICNRTCGGVAYVGVFDRVGAGAQPAWVFPQALRDDPKNVAEAAAHEAGHNLGLDHDGTAVQGYYAGHGAWAPVMGVGYDKPVVQWSQGSYPGADNQQDDLDVLAGYLGNRQDEAGGSADDPSVLPDREAVIGTPDDVDAYLLGTCAAGAVVDVLPAAVAPDLDVRATLYDADGTQRAVAQPASGNGDGTTASGLGGSLTVPTGGDGWVLSVEGVGEGAWAALGYDDYGSLGAYTVSAPGCDGEVAAGSPGAPADVTGATAGTDGLTLAWDAPAVTGDGPVTGYVVSRSGSAATQTLGAAARSHTFTGLTPGTTYQLSVRAVNASGVGPSVMVSATTEPPTPAVPSVPRDLTGSYDAQADRLQAFWTEPAAAGTQPISGYRVYLDGNLVGPLAAGIRGVALTRQGGFGDGQYVVGIAAVNAVGLSPVATTTITVDHPDRPANDDVADAEVLASTDGSVLGDNSQATSQGTDPTPPSSRAAGGHSVWFSWTPASDGPVTLETSGGGAGRDTTLGVYAGPASGLVQVAGDDDGAGLHARVAFEATAGTRYLVAVDGFGTTGGAGPFTLGWSQRRAPSAPGTPSGVPGEGRATVAWAAASGNGSPVTGYSVTSSPGGQTCTTTGALSCTVEGLSNGTPYTFRVRATNAVGDGAQSAASVAVTPAGPPSQVARPQVVVRGTKAIVTWSAATPRGTPVTGYVVDIDRGRDRSAPSSARKAVFKRLQPGRYQVRVAARSGLGTAPYSSWATLRVR